MGLRMSPRWVIQKTGPPSNFPTQRPRDAKIKPKRLPTIHEEGSWGNSTSDERQVGLLHRCFCLCVVFLGVFSSPLHRLVSLYWAYLLAAVLCHLSRELLAVLSATVGYSRFHNCKPCFPGSGWRSSRSVGTPSGARRLPFPLYRWANAYILNQYRSVLDLCLRLATEVLLIW